MEVRGGNVEGWRIPLRWEGPGEVLSTAALPAQHLGQWSRRLRKVSHRSNTNSVWKDAQGLGRQGGEEISDPVTPLLKSNTGS